MRKKLTALVLLFALLAVFVPSPAVVADGVPQIKNVIYMIPDGGGYALYDFANAVKELGGFAPGKFPYKTQVEQGPLTLKDYLICSETTHSYGSSKPVTDSAAAGTALSSGYKTYNGRVGVDENGRPRATLLEAAQTKGMKTGMISTYIWSHATPAAFSSHAMNRDSFRAEIEEQIVNQEIDVVLGVGFGDVQFSGSRAEVERRGYKIVNNKIELANVKQGERIWGNCSSGTFDFDINLQSYQPTLAQMTEAAIRALDGSENGFFLMVEGSRVDSGGHVNNIVQAVSEYLAFDAAFKVAVDFAKTRNDTIVIGAPDHDTGGLNLPNRDSMGGNPNSNDYAAAAAEVRQGTNSKNGISWTSEDHTGRNGPVWLYAPQGVPLPNGLTTTPGDTPQNRSLTVDNTDLPKYVAGLLGVSLEEVTNKLFVDVTNQGTYNSSTKTFTFSNGKIVVKANQSVATVNGKTVDLKGQVTVYANNKFYVPQYLLNFPAWGVGAITSNGDTVTVNVVNYDSGAALPRLLLAAYDDNGALLAVRTADVTSDRTNYDFNLAGVTGIRYFKAYLWDGLARINPVVDATTVFKSAA